MAHTTLGLNNRPAHENRTFHTGVCTPERSCWAKTPYTQTACRSCTRKIFCSARNSRKNNSLLFRNNSQACIFRAHSAKLSVWPYTTRRVPRLRPMAGAWPEPGRSLAGASEKKYKKGIGRSWQWPELAMAGANWPEPQ